MNTAANLNNLENLRDDQFEALLHISRLLNRATLQEHLITEALDLVVSVLGAERGLFVRRAGEDNFTIIAARNLEQENITDLSQFSSGILQQVIETGKPQLYHDIQADPTVSQFQSVLIQQIKSVIGVPIFLNGEVWGVILADSRSRRARFTEESLKFLEFFSNMVTLALDKIIAVESLRDENAVLRNRMQMAGALPDMVGQSAAMRRTADLIHRVAKTDATVLLLGESGTGKELAARAIHQLSSRRDKPFIGQFCGSIPDTLLESELFGYRKGAFSGAAADKKGLFEVASGGTFFLDEIGDVSPTPQTKLLRELQNQELIRLGDTQVKKVDVRIIAATNQDLKRYVAEGRFREDLYYRLNVFPITLPPLRERREDIPLLAQHFIAKYGRRVALPPAALNKLMDYHWPGNVRQLENVIRRALIMCDGDKLQPEHIVLEDTAQMPLFGGTLKEIENSLLLARLKAFNGNRTQTAKSLGLSVRWVQLKLKEMGKGE